MKVTRHEHVYNGFRIIGITVKYNPMFKDLWLVFDLLVWGFSVDVSFLKQWRAVK